jgi:hypothetical protein
MDLQEARATGGRLRQRKRNRAWASRRGYSRWRNGLHDLRSCGALWLDIQDGHILNEGNPRDLLNHKHNMWSIATVLKRTHQDVDDLIQDIVKDIEVLLLEVILNEILLILGIGSGISNSGCHGDSEEVVEGIELMQEILSLWRMSLVTYSIHE